MKTKYIANSLLCLFTIASCSKVNDLGIEKKISFSATIGDDAATKTVLVVNDGHTQGTIHWLAGDEINLFYGSSSSSVFTANTVNGKKASFDGTLSNYRPSSDDYFWAVYPYSAENACDGKSVTVELPSTQVAEDGTFADDLFISIAKTKGWNLVFYNLCGGICFTVTKPGIKSIVISGNNHEILAGKVKVKMGSDDRPVVESIVDAKESIELLPPTGGAFRTGTYYYAAALPVELTKGYSIEMRTESEEGTRTSNNPVTIKRSIWGTLDGMDSSVEFTRFVIDFEDSEVRKLCLENFDEDGDGRLTKEEAAKVTSLGKIFQNNQSIFTFDELQYFTGLQTIKGAFFDCGNLESVKLPEINEIGDSAFKCCYSLTSIQIPNSVVVIAEDAFYQCEQLSSITWSNSLEKIKSRAFLGTALTEVELPTSLKYLEYASFAQCPKLATISIPETLQTEKTEHWFASCPSLKVVNLPPSITEIGEKTFKECSSLEEITMYNNVKAIGKEAFYKCKKLETFNFSTGLESIGDYAFYDCEKLGSHGRIDLPNRLKTIGNYALATFYPVPIIKIPKTVTWIGSSGIIGCDTLVLEPLTPPDGTGSPVGGSTQILYVPENRVDAYKAAKLWKPYAALIKPNPGNL